MKVLFVDESGDHNLSVIDPQYPVFVLGGVVVDSEYAENELTERANSLKLRLFGTASIVLHTADLCRNRNGFQDLADPSFRQRFYEEINSLMESLEYLVVACAIRKHDYLVAFGAGRKDPYVLGLESVADSFLAYLKDIDSEGTIVAESRGPVLDAELARAWQRLELGGTSSIPGPLVRQRIRSLSLRPKNDNIAGLQLADLVVGPIGRFVLGKTTHEDFRIIERKFLGETGPNARGSGLIVLPKDEG
jgi:hypothetical protein